MSLSTALDSVARLINFRRRREGFSAADVAELDGSGLGSGSNLEQSPLVIAHLPPTPAKPSRVVSLAPLTEMLSAYLGEADIKRIKDAYRQQNGTIDDLRWVAACRLPPRAGNRSRDGTATAAATAATSTDGGGLARCTAASTASSI